MTTIITKNANKIITVNDHDQLLIMIMNMNMSNDEGKDE